MIPLRISRFFGRIVLLPVMALVCHQGLGDEVIAPEKPLQQVITAEQFAGMPVFSGKLLEIKRLDAAGFTAARNSLDFRLVISADDGTEWVVDRIPWGMPGFEMQGACIRGLGFLQLGKRYRLPEAVLMEGRPEELAAPLPQAVTTEALAH
jgi:hypothetical protein